MSAVVAEHDTGPAAPAFPVPSVGHDARFTFGLALDVADVLVAHGYPRPSAGSDWVDLQQALFRFLHSTTRP